MDEYYPYEADMTDVSDSQLKVAERIRDLLYR
jgi:hypothetical protein